MLQKIFTGALALSTAALMSACGSLTDKDPLVGDWTSTRYETTLNKEGFKGGASLFITHKEDAIYTVTFRSNVLNMDYLDLEYINGVEFDLVGELIDGRLVIKEWPEEKSFFSTAVYWIDEKSGYLTSEADDVRSPDKKIRSTYARGKPASLYLQTEQEVAKSSFLGTWRPIEKDMETEDIIIKIEPNGKLYTMRMVEYEGESFDKEGVAMMLIDGGCLWFVEESHNYVPFQLCQKGSPKQLILKVYGEEFLTLGRSK